MPKFLYTIIVLTVLSWYLLFSFMDSFAPSSIFSKLGALVIFFSATTMTTSLIAYQRKPTELKEEPRKLYREILKKSLTIGALLTFLIALKIIVIK